MAGVSRKPIRIIIAISLMFFILVSIYVIISLASYSFFITYNYKFYKFWKATAGEIRNGIKNIATRNLKLREIADKYENEIVDIATLDFYTKYVLSKDKLSYREWIQYRLKEFPLNKVGQIEFTDIRIIEIPYEALGFFGNVTTLNMIRCGLTDEILKESWKLAVHLPKIGMLDLSHNRLRKIPDVSRFKPHSSLILKGNSNLDINGRLNLFESGVVYLNGTKATIADANRLKKQYEDVRFIV